MNISKDKRIEEVQAEFNIAYPGLKINFVKRKHDVNEASPKDSIYAENLTLRQIQAHIMDGYVSLEPSKKVQDLEKEMESRFNLHVQIYRRYKDKWIQTSITDDWTLHTQNITALNSFKENY